MRYTDAKGRTQTLTLEQARYLSVADRELDYGWGGMRSTLTVRLLRDRGLITLDELRYKPWRITTRTPLGSRVLADWQTPITVGGDRS